MSVITQGPLTITNVESSHSMPNIKSIDIYNAGLQDLRVAFDRSTAIGAGYTLVPAGTSLSVDDHIFRTLYMISNTASSTTVHLTITSN